MQEVGAPSLIAEMQVGVSPEALCLRLKGSGVVSAVLEGASVALIVARSEVSVILIERSWMGVGTIIEAAVPLGALGANGGGDLHFAVQVKDRSGAVLETVPHGRSWTIAIPGPDSARTDWQA